MKQFSVIFNNKTYFFDPKKPLHLAIELMAGDENPNCYYAENPVFQTIKADNFIGNVAQGGSCNYQKIMLTPHGNGTHTECYGHISAHENATVSKCFNENLFLAQLVTLTPKPIILTEKSTQKNTTNSNVDSNDFVVTFEDFLVSLEGKNIAEIEAIIIRTLPNGSDKKTKKYSDTNPPYLDFRICKYLADNNITHLLLDLPSVDKEIDGGELKAHHAFWQITNNQEDDNKNQQQISTNIRKNTGITEMIFVDNEIKNGLYLLDLQILRMNIDAVPSKPILYELYQ